MANREFVKRSAALVLQPLLIRYFLAGFVSTAAYVVLYFVLTHLGQPNGVSSYLAFGLSVVVQYLGLAHYAFRVEMADVFQLARFAVTVIFGFAVSGLVMEQTVGTSDVVQFAALMVITAIVAGFNFCMFFFWVFVRRAAV
jgi:putative flippase GtrA